MQYTRLGGRGKRLAVVDSLASAACGVGEGLRGGSHKPRTPKHRQSQGQKKWQNRQALHIAQRPASKGC